MKTTCAIKCHSAMVQRCTNPNDPSWTDYGGRGITVYPQWCGEGGYHRFMQDMGPRPPGLTIERVDVDLGYFPENCRWATRKEQANNRRNNHTLTLEGETRTVAQWAERAGVSSQVIKWRMNQGWPLDRALVEPARLKWPNGAGRNPGWKARSKVRCAERLAA